MVTLDYPPVGGGASIDRLSPEPLGHRRRPLAHWYEAESDALVVLAGPFSEDLDHDNKLPLPLTPQRVPDDRPQGMSALPRVPLRSLLLAVRRRGAEWPELPGSDAHQLRRLSASVSHSERERAALELTLRLPAQAMVETAHFRSALRLPATLTARQRLFRGVRTRPGFDRDLPLLARAVRARREARALE